MIIAVSVDVHIIPFPFDCKYDDHGSLYETASVAIVYPPDDAMTLTQLDKSQLAALVTLVAIDCLLQKAPSILNHPTLLHLRRVLLAQRPVQSKIKRYHSISECCVSTIEAAHTKNHSFLDIFTV